MKYKLVCFDVDGTLVPWDGTEFLPGVEDKLADLDCQKIALVTNQGGPACRDAGWPWSYKYPTMIEVNNRLVKIKWQVIDASQDLPVSQFVAWAYVTKDNKVLFPKHCPKAAQDVNLRKPNPGMILAAMRQAGVKAADTLMVGDGDEDKEAAQAAGVDFVWAEDFFGGKWDELGRAK